jgi:hypothetical protein
MHFEGAPCHERRLDRRRATAEMLGERTKEGIHDVRYHRRGALDGVPVRG